MGLTVKTRQFKYVDTVLLLFYFFSVSRFSFDLPGCLEIVSSMGLFNFGKKTKPPKDTSPESNPQKSIPKVSSKARSQLANVSDSSGELERTVSDLLVGDVDSPLTMTPTREATSLLDDILSELTGQSLDQKVQTQGKPIISSDCNIDLLIFM